MGIVEPFIVSALKYWAGHYLRLR
eukprot:Gb_23637 [translate_table: standard]